MAASVSIGYDQQDKKDSVWNARRRGGSCRPGLCLSPRLSSREWGCIGLGFLRGGGGQSCEGGKRGSPSALKDGAVKANPKRQHRVQAICLNKQPSVKPAGLTRRVERTGGSRFAQAVFGRQQRLPPVAHFG